MISNFIYKGKRYNDLKELCEEKGILFQKAYSRIKKGISIEDSVDELLDLQNVEKQYSGLEKTFENCQFKLYIPEVKKQFKEIRVSTTLVMKRESYGVLEVVGIELIDSESHKKILSREDVEPCIILCSKRKQPINAVVPADIETERGIILIYHFINREQCEMVDVHYYVSCLKNIYLLGTNVDTISNINVRCGDLETAGITGYLIPFSAWKILNQTEQKTRESYNRISELQEQLNVTRTEKEKLERKDKERNKELIKLKNNLEMLDEKRNELEKKLNDALKAKKYEPKASDMERHLNSIIDYMTNTAKILGLNLNNMYIRTSWKDNKHHVNLYGEILFDKGVTEMQNACYIKAVLYDVNGNIELESKHYVSKSFSGFDTFNIGWEGGSTESWLNETKIRVFLVKA